MNNIWVRDHVKGRWIEADWVMNAQVNAPFSRDVLAAAKRVLERSDNQLTGKDVVEQVNRILISPATAKERSASKRAQSAEPSVPQLSEQDDSAHSAKLQVLIGAHNADEVQSGDIVPTPEETPPAKQRRKAARRIDGDDFF